MVPRSCGDTQEGLPRRLVKRHDAAQEKPRRVLDPKTVELEVKKEPGLGVPGVRKLHAEVQAAQLLGLVPIGHPLEADEKPTRVWSRGLNRKDALRLPGGSATRKHLTARLEALRKLGQELHDHLAIEPVWFDDPADDEPLRALGLRQAGFAIRLRTVSLGVAPFLIQAAAFSRSSLRIGGFLVGS